MALLVADGKVEKREFRGPGETEAHLWRPVVELPPPVREALAPPPMALLLPPPPEGTSCTPGMAAFIPWAGMLGSLE